MLSVIIINKSRDMKQMNSLEDVVTHPDTVDISKDLVEMTMDAFVKDDLLKEIPVVKSFLGVYGIVNKVDEYFFSKKINQILFEIKDVSSDHRMAKIAEINESEDFAGNVGERLLETLRVIESNNKPKLIGKLFRAVLLEKIDYRIFLRLCFVINIIYFEDLLWLANNSDGTITNDNVPDTIIINGLVTLPRIEELDEMMAPDFEFNEVKPQLTEHGKILFNFGFN